MTLELQRHVQKDDESPFYIDELIKCRRAKRGFTDKSVPTEVVKDILSIARFAPSSSNTQPWKCYVLTGKARERVVAAAVKNFNDNHDKLTPEYPFFPEPLHEPHLSVFTKFRGQLGDAQGVERSDKESRRRDVARQFMFFGAPVGLIFTMDRKLVPASFICYGAFLQTVMLAAQGRGLDTLPQQIWSLQYQVLRKELGIPESDMVVCGMCIGYADNGLPENNIALDKFGPEKFATFLDV
ncbi:nitroreductase [Bradyrhizobium neotropicale]|uniref:nitroreductase n=1 Tax=Bradyrhizobium neotropicale TaxID=1497615 RepID=UPI001AD7B3C3|nr:nitroreductase [Bradyrhizobium neotropicale]MBO4225806.1 nitroreductase [Bradyrhizobium neotropicale]